MRDRSMTQNVPGARPTTGESQSDISDLSYALSRESAPRTSTWLRSRQILATLLAVASHSSLANAQSCIPLASSTQCPAFNASSISTSSNLTDLFPFLSSVHNVATFDAGLQTYVSGDFARQRYQQLLGCSDFDSSNTTTYYARFTTSVLCNAIVQNSIQACNLDGVATAPLCADTCASYVETEHNITYSNLCGSPGPNAAKQLRADFTNCALPADAIGSTCIEGVENEPDNCGFTDNTAGLCSYCAASSPNATDSCCVFSDTTSRCKGVILPVAAIATTPTSAAATSRSTSTSSTFSPTLDPFTGKEATHAGLTSGQIAGAVIGSIIGLCLLLALLLLAYFTIRRRHDRSSVAHGLSARKLDGQHDGSYEVDNAERKSEVVPLGGRVTRMSALENNDSVTHLDPHAKPVLSTIHDSSSSDHDSLVNFSQRYGSSRLPTRTGSSGASAGGESRGRSLDYARLDVFKDYYSDEHIRPGDLVSTLWAYSPQVHDEFELERGDMLKVHGIWDDGWATGVHVSTRAEAWSMFDEKQHDGGLPHNQDGRATPPPIATLKAFPLVCVCSPRHWKRVIEEESTESGISQFLSRPSHTRPGT